MPLVKQAKLAVLVEKLTTLKDGCVKIITVTRELSDEAAALLLSFRNKEAWQIMVNYDDAPDTIELPNDGPAGNVGQKSPSQRLRSVLFRYWESKRRGGDGGTFDTFYANYIEQIIEAIKEKIN